MLKFAGSCSPEQLHTLQKVFDLIWMELRASTMSNYSGPSDPDVLRDEIARRVLGQFNGNGIDADEITKQVLGSFGLKFTHAQLERPTTGEMKHGHDNHKS
jgi:hypothetical protein